jgi:hypothetical protein
MKQMEEDEVEGFKVKRPLNFSETRFANWVSNVAYFTSISLFCSRFTRHSGTLLVL